jgi:triacylglycerol lipase
MTPIVLQHGLFGFSQLGVGDFKLSYFHKIDRALRLRGHPLIVSQVHPTGSIEMRANQLKQTILDRCEKLLIDEPVVIVAHSMGGLDARYMITHLEMAHRVAALVTISTPHRGSPYADWSLKNLGRRLGGLKLMRLLKLDVSAIQDLTVRSCEKFNEQVPDHPDVKYYSISAARPWAMMPPFLMHSCKVIYDAEGDNDGMVSVKSASWGEHLETWQADHLHVINKRFVWLRDQTGDIVPYYMKMLERVAG